MSQGQVVGAALAALLAAVSVAATPGATVQTRVPSEPPAMRRPNVLIFLVDDLGQRDIGAYGSTFHETPHADRLAREGLRFDAAYASAPVCSPTRASLMTGLWPQRTGITDYIGAPPTPDAWTRNTRALPAPFADRLALDALTIAEHARANGYATFFAGKWHLGPEGWWPEDQGFGVNMGGIDRGGPYGGKRYFSPYGNPRLPDGPDGEHLPHRLAVETARFIATPRDAPFLAVLSFYSVHTPLMARADLQRTFEDKRSRLGLEPRWGREGERDVRLVQEHAVYAAMVAAMDEAVGTVLTALDTAGLRDDTLVIFTSDNGGLSTSEGWPTSNVPLRAGKGWLYEGGLRVPLMMRWPARQQPQDAGRLVHTPVVTMDVAATVVDAMTWAPAAGEVATQGPQGSHEPETQPRSAPGVRRLDGVSLLPLLAGGSLAADRPLYWHYPHYGNQGGAPGAAVRQGDLKLIEWFEDGRIELFDVARDVSETTDVAAARPADVARLRELLRAWQREVGAKQTTTNAAYDPATPSGRAAQRTP